MKGLAHVGDFCRAVMVINCCIWFEQKIHWWRTFKGGGEVFLKHLYLNDNA